jgi:hypothetical protein
MGDDLREEDHFQREDLRMVNHPKTPAGGGQHNRPPVRDRSSSDNLSLDIHK